MLAAYERGTAMRHRAKTIILMGVALTALLLVGLVSGCGDGAVVGTESTDVVSDAATTIPTDGAYIETDSGAPVAGADHPAADLAAGPLSAEEEEALLYLAEEEKLAHDVYVALYGEWSLRVFDNISASETKHMASMQSLLANYGLSDPIAGNEMGVFSNAELQRLYDTLVAQGVVSGTAALDVGVAIETADIQDLEALLGLTTHSDVVEVAQNLLAGSQKHLEAFSKNR